MRTTYANLPSGPVIVHSVEETRSRRRELFRQARVHIETELKRLFPDVYIKTQEFDFGSKLGIRWAAGNRQWQHYATRKPWSKGIVYRIARKITDSKPQRIR